MAALPELDRTDLRMLTLLQTQGRMQNTDLARKLALSPAPSLRRLQRLEASGVITHYAAIVDPRKVGLGVTAHLDVMLDKQAEHARSTFRNAVQRWPEVLTGYALTGQWDYSLKVVARDLDAYAHFLMEKVLALPVVVNVQSAFVLETVKDTTALPL
ncbi:MAG TPA: Lrp/AsnC family transcriptional regulator [Casimicrobiaceae bacterium]|jgi:Lrp/AsnC family leucine-responsive transcriptional regulator|nr:Lrp/AsnC family transcriptional regulator [Casimicrobiaceae bacterium]